MIFSVHYYDTFYPKSNDGHFCSKKKVKINAPTRALLKTHLNRYMYENTFYASYKKIRSHKINLTLFETRQ